MGRVRSGEGLREERESRPQVTFPRDLASSRSLVCCPSLPCVTHSQTCVLGPSGACLARLWSQTDGRRTRPPTPGVGRPWVVPFPSSLNITRCPLGIGLLAVVGIDLQLAGGRATSWVDPTAWHVLDRGTRGSQGQPSKGRQGTAACAPVGTRALASWEVPSRRARPWDIKPSPEKGQSHAGLRQDTPCTGPPAPHGSRGQATRARWLWGARSPGAWPAAPLQVAPSRTPGPDGRSSCPWCRRATASSLALRERRRTGQARPASRGGSISGAETCNQGSESPGAGRPGHRAGCGTRTVPSLPLPTCAGRRGPCHPQRPPDLARPPSTDSTSSSRTRSASSDPRTPSRAPERGRSVSLQPPRAGSRRARAPSPRTPPAAPGSLCRR